MNNSILFEKMTESHDMLLETIRHFITRAMANLAVTSFTYLEHVWRLWLMYSKRTTPWSQFSDISQCNWQLVNQSADWQQLKRGGSLHPLTFTRQGLCQRADLSLTQDRSGHKGLSGKPRFPVLTVFTSRFYISLELPA